MVDFKKALALLECLEKSYPLRLSYANVKAELNFGEHSFSAIIDYLSEFDYVKIGVENKSPSTIGITPEGINFLKEEHRRLTEEKLTESNYFLTVMLVVATIGTFFVSYEQSTPKLIGPAFLCPNAINASNTNFVMFLGNYGEIPANVRFNWEGDNIEGYSTYSTQENFNNKIFVTAVYVPVNYQNNQQTPFEITMRIKNVTKDSAGFKIKWTQVDGVFNILIDKFEKPITCSYYKESNSTYKLVKS